ncbi:MAG: cyclic nucleotide-binding domain-containing protein, partial [Endomicrobia bacterium]|nr:cyclic nucleotide-binding domain-containing protein [Endomicrobiia bacterium]
MKNQVEFLLEIPMFSGVNKDVVNQISQSALEKRYIDNEVIFEENTAGEDLYIICSGKVQIIKNYHKQNEKLLSILTEGEIFGETCLFTKSLRSATA